MEIECKYSNLRPECSRQHLPIFLVFKSNKKLLFQLNEKLDEDKLEKLILLASSAWFYGLTVLSITYNNNEQETTSA